MHHIENCRARDCTTREEDKCKKLEGNSSNNDVRRFVSENLHVIHCKSN
jgi:hypothetical protein